MASSAQSSLAQLPEAAGKAPSKKHHAPQKRKRTKTGCLTCRKRRIKCDESHPICANCIRSHRHCEGYKTPLVFRTSEPASYAFSHFDPHGIPNAPANYYQHQHGGQFQTDALEHGAYRPVPGPLALDTSSAMSLPYISPTSGPVGPHAGVPRSILSPYHHHAYSSSHSDGSHSAFADWPRDHSNGHSYSEPFAVSSARYPASIPSVPHATDFSLGAAPALADTMSAAYYHHSQPHSASSVPHEALLSSSTLAPIHTIPWTEETASAYPAPMSAPLAFSTRHSADDNLNLRTTTSLGSLTHPNDYQDGDSSAGRDVLPPFAYTPNSAHHNTNHAVHPQILSPSEPPYIPISTQPVANSHGPHPIESLDLDPYFPRVEEMLLSDPYTKSTFQHFMRETGSMLTAFDRSSALDDPILDRHGRALAYPGLWTYTMPMLALKNIGLLHGMLALASLQMAQQTGDSNTPSWKHYTYAWRKVHSAARDPAKRRDLSIFAATMLLAYYEVATADHSKWNMHLSAAAQLIRVAELHGMSKQIRFMARERTTARLSGSYEYSEQSPGLNNVLDQFSDFDINFVSELVGEPLYTDETGDVWLHNHRKSAHRMFSPSDLTDFTLYQDLFWWYIRHDMIHALVGGTELLLDYRLWTDCPPRAPVGQGMAHYGSFDHLMLLMGRLIVWAHKDRPRKKQLWEKERGQTGRKRRTSDTSQKTSSSSDTSPKSQGQRAKVSRGTPSFYGMAPSHGQPPLPQAFGTHEPVAPLPEVQEEGYDLEQATFTAFDEWNSIRRAFDSFQSALGPDFEPLSEEEYPSFDTPFGRALIYRSHGIACLMAWYYTGLIVALRAQPNMPPFATMAVGAATAWTKNIANTIGRVLAGMRPVLTQRPLRPSDAGPIADGVIPLLFAGVQFMEADQRAWTVDWFGRADELTSFASISICCRGCEGAWTRMAEAGRGPPYTRTLNIDEMPADVNGSAQESPGIGENDTVRVYEESYTTASPRSGKEVKRTFVKLQRGDKVMKAYQLYTAADALGEDIQRLVIDAN